MFLGAAKTMQQLWSLTRCHILRLTIQTSRPAPLKPVLLGWHLLGWPDVLGRKYGVPNAE
jgi:hypothetical protein